MKNFTLLSVVALIAGCSASAPPRAPELEQIDPFNGKFCELRTSTVVSGGGMYSMKGASIQFVGRCKHRLINKGDYLIVYLGDPGLSLMDDLDFYLHPENYYTSKEISELDCDEYSKCYSDRIEAVRQREESLRMKEWAKGQIKRGVAVSFDSGSIEPKDIEILRQMAEAAHGERLTVVVAGHTDSVGSDKLNDDLAFRRADRVRQLLVNAGVDDKGIKVISMGEKSPITTNQTISGRALNRRAVVKGNENGDAN